jgi:hypothetical protein
MMLAKRPAFGSKAYRCSSLPSTSSREWFAAEYRFHMASVDTGAQTASERKSLGHDGATKRIAGKIRWLQAPTAGRFAPLRSMEWQRQWQNSGQPNEFADNPTE